MSRGAALAAVGLVVAAAAGGLYLLGTSGADHPDEWDPRVRPIAEFVERRRGLEFEHPVDVEFMDDERFRHEVTTGAGEITEEERRDIERFTAVLRALGLLRGEVDLLEELNELSARGILGFYESDPGRIVINGTDLSLGHRSTLAHELTHALQDQHFDLDRFDEDDPELGPYQALAEGDAGRVENAWVETLPRRERRALDRAQREELDRAALEEFPPVLVDVITSPYVLGEGLLAVLEAQGGDAVDDAFRRPPSSDEHLLDPWTYVDGDDPEEVPAPALEDGETAAEVGGEASGDFGALGWYLLLAQRLDPRRALAAVDGWGGDAYVTFRRDGRVCVRVTFRGEDSSETAEMAGALDAWVEADPDRRRTFRGVVPVAGDRETVTLTSCDPGASGQEPGGRRPGEGPLVLPLARAAFTVGVMEAGIPESTARCGVERLVARVESDVLVEALQSPEPDAAFARQARAAFEGCRNA